MGKKRASIFDGEHAKRMFKLTYLARVIFEENADIRSSRYNFHKSVGGRRS